MTRYVVRFQYRPKDSVRPVDEAQDVPMDDIVADEPALVPNIGDHVDFDPPGRWWGVVEARLFRYIALPGVPVTCLVNVVLTDSDTEIGRLVAD
jgi:hypothetical protein